jgi:uncharacterized protein YxjI
MKKLLTFILLLVAGVSSAQTNCPYRLEEKFFSYGVDMDVYACEKKVGLIEERTLNIGKTFEYFDLNKTKVCSAKQRSLSFETTIDIYDTKKNRIGTIKQNIFEGLFSISNVYEIQDSYGRVIAKSEKIDMFSTSVKISSGSKLIATIERNVFNFGGDTWNVKITDPSFDYRLFLFIPAYKTSADAEKK